MSDEFDRGFQAGLQVSALARMTGPEALAWSETQQAEHQRERAAECDANGRHMRIESGTTHCGHCDRRYEDGPGI